MSLPDWYKEWVERVSNIVSFVYPFSWEDKQRYLKWLNINWIEEKTYMEEACTIGTFVHDAMERRILKKKQKKKDEAYALHKDEIEYWLSYLKALKWELIPEVIILDKKERYQGTTDLVRVDEETKTVWLYDWKTWWIAKKRFNLPNKYRKPYSKLKKVALQLSLYAEYYREKGYEIGGIYVVWLHETGCYPFELDLYSSESLNEILTNFKEWQLETKNEK